MLLVISSCLPFVQVYGLFPVIYQCVMHLLIPLIPFFKVFNLLLSICVKPILDTLTRFPTTYEDLFKVCLPRKLRITVPGL